MNELDMIEAQGADVHFFDTESGPHVLLPDGSRVYQVTPAIQAELERASGQSREALARALEHLGLATKRPFVEPAPPPNPPIRALSLAVAQKCNLGCTYCYAQEGTFGGPSRSMSDEVAEASVRRLFTEASAGQLVRLSFLGGEPLTHRRLVRSATELAVALGREKAVAVRFSITTNGTLLTPDDGDFFERYGFSVTVSLDGVGEVNDRLRPFKGGVGSYERVLERVKPLLARQQRTHWSARVTVTPLNLELPRTLEQFIELGFRSVGFSPMLRSPSGHNQMDVPDLYVMLQQMIECGRAFEKKVLASEPFPFSNMETALWEIHRGTHRPYPCGAGGGYLGVSAEGGLFACHRFVDEPMGAMGDVRAGVDAARQSSWLEGRHVDRQEPCRGCWARYLCGGGCHHEVIHRGRPACAYIRGWLHYCLQAYTRLSEARPDYFSKAPGSSS